jgi:hypothetical protein
MSAYDGLCTVAPSSYQYIGRSADRPPNPSGFPPTQISGINGGCLGVENRNPGYATGRMAPRPWRRLQGSKLYSSIVSARPEASADRAAIITPDCRWTNYRSGTGTTSVPISAARNAALLAMSTPGQTAARLSTSIRAFREYDRQAIAIDMIAGGADDRLSRIAGRPEGKQLFHGTSAKTRNCK